MMDYTKFASIIVILTPIATILLLALQLLILLWQSKISKKQTEITERQLKYLLKKEYPILRITDKRYVGDNLHLKIKNEGKEKACFIALKIGANVIKPKKVLDIDGSAKISTWGDWDLIKQAHMNYLGEIYELRDQIFFIYPSNENVPELNPGEEGEFVVKLRFWFYRDEKKKFFSHRIGFAELAKTLHENKIDLCEINFILLYKNLIGEFIDEINIDNFAINPERVGNKKLGSLSDKEKLLGGIALRPMHPYKKQEFNFPFTYEDYSNIQ